MIYGFNTSTIMNALNLITDITKICAVLMLSIVLSGCAKENEEYIFVHDSNLIRGMTCQQAHTGGQFRGEIYEFDKDGQLMEGDFTQEEIEGGYGLILFPISASLQDEIDLTSMYLKAEVSYDMIITPTLTGKKDISGEGLIITVTSGEKTKRQYRVRGFFE